MGQRYSVVDKHSNEKLVTLGFFPFDLSPFLRYSNGLPLSTVNMPVYMCVLCVLLMSKIIIMKPTVVATETSKFKFTLNIYFTHIYYIYIHIHVLPF